MQVESLASFGAGTIIDTDLVIVGGGPAGLTIAREFFGTPIRVLVVESGGLKEDPQIASLNAVESAGEPASPAQACKRTQFHGATCPSWSGEEQPFGVRCRVLGGSTQAWAGKSAAFDQADFAPRAWMPYSGWPFAREALEPFLDRAADVLNLGPNRYDESLWELIGAAPPKPDLDVDVLKPFFWQFARSRINKLDIMRFGPEFLAFDAPNVRVLLNATATRIDTNAEGTALSGVEVSTIDGARSYVRAKACVLAASGIENPRLLLLSNAVHGNGIGNAHGVVGRFLMDHPSARIGRFGARECAAVQRRFGFYGVRHGGRTHMYLHGLVPSQELLEREQLPQCALYMMEERAPDDPWDALKRLLQARSARPIADAVAVAASPGLLAKGIGRRVFESSVVPPRLKQRVVDALIRYNPGFVVREYQNRGLPHKLTGLQIDGISEQRPDPESRITLSSAKDALGMPKARIYWRIDTDARRALVRLGQLLAAELSRAGLPAPVLEDWVAQDRPEDGVIIDMGHTLGTTRMSDNPRQGVVDARCQVHGVAGLYVAGGSVFPTSGHANPTLMIVALAIRLADHLRQALRQ